MKTSELSVAKLNTTIGQILAITRTIVLKKKTVITSTLSTDAEKHQLLTETKMCCCVCCRLNQTEEPQK